jgi:hypothetical protein
LALLAGGKKLVGLFRWFDLSRYLFFNILKSCILAH